MNVYIEDDYFDVLEKLRASLPHDTFTNNKAQNLKSIYNLLLSLNINTDIKYEKLTANFKNRIGDKDYKTIKELVLFTALKSPTSKIHAEVNFNTINDYSGFYFTKNINYTLNAPGYGIVYKDENFDSANFYENCTVADLKFKGDINALKDFVAPTNAMIIADNYLFEDPAKLPHLINFIKLFKAKLSEIKFQVSIFSHSSNATLVTNVFKQIQEIDPNIQVEIILTSNKTVIRDRQIYTNYTTMNFGHPFEEKETHFSQNFLGVENDVSRIKINYANFISHLKMYKQKIDGTPETFGITKMKWKSEEFTNRLFEIIPKI